ncbi:MAG: formate dehydrogenase accessory sulfurtransferase FdhD [Rubricoccaceae bacterium]
MSKKQPAVRRDPSIPLRSTQDDKVGEDAVGVTSRVIVQVWEGQATSTTDALAVEEPLEIRLMWGDRVQRLAVTMRTPGHDAELAVGFLVGEGVIRQSSGRRSQPEDVIETFHTPLKAGATDPNVVVVRLAEDVTFDARRLERHVYTTSSCGVCGKTSLEAVGVIQGPVLPEGPVLTTEIVSSLPGMLRAQQDGFDQTGGLHAAALFTAEGKLVRVREDVGRHNAVDKLVGSFLLDRQPVPQSVLLVSGRASFELAQKAFVAGIPVLAAVGAPSSLAVDLATEHGMTLLGFVREGRFNVYAGRQRIALPS